MPLRRHRQRPPSAGAVKPEPPRRATPIEQPIPVSTDYEEPTAGSWTLLDSYEGTGYPKGLGHGPRVRMVKSNGRTKIVEGLPYEEMPSRMKSRMNARPYDDAGQLRIWVRSKTSVGMPYYELGSRQHAAKLATSLRARESDLTDSNVDISYATRPSLDDVKDRKFPGKK